MRGLRFPAARNFVLSVESNAYKLATDTWHYERGACNFSILSERDEDIKGMFHVHE